MLRFAAGVSFCAATVVGVRQVFRTQQRWDREDTRSQQHSLTGKPFSGVWVEERGVQFEVLKYIAPFLPLHQALLIPRADGSIRHVGITESRLPNTCWWQTHWYPQESLSPDSRLIPVEAYDPYWQKHGKAPLIDVDRLHQLTHSPDELPNPRDGLQGYFLWPKNGRLHSCRGAVGSAIEKASMVTS